MPADPIGPACGHEEHAPGCGPCEAGLRRLEHMRDAHGMESVDCPACAGTSAEPCKGPGCLCHVVGGVACETCGGEGVVFRIPIAAGACSDGAACPLRWRGAAA